MPIYLRPAHTYSELDLHLRSVKIADEIIVKLKSLDMRIHVDPLVDCVGVGVAILASRREAIDIAGEVCVARLLVPAGALKSHDGELT